MGSQTPQCEIFGLPVNGVISENAGNGPYNAKVVSLRRYGGRRPVVDSHHAPAHATTFLTLSMHFRLTAACGTIYGFGTGAALFRRSPIG